MVDLSADDARQQLGTGSEHGEREPRGDRFCIDRDVSMDAVQTLGAGQAQPKAGDHFIDDEQRAVLAYIDVLVDGKFEQSLADASLVFRGSSNQIIRLL